MSEAYITLKNAFPSWTPWAVLGFVLLMFIIIFVSVYTEEIKEKIKKLLKGGPD